MAVKIQIRRDTAANWTANNPTMSQGEIAYEVDTERFKIGNGSDAWTTLNYVGVDGADGYTPLKGTDYFDGDNAYTVAVNEGFVGDESAWLASLVGPQGIQGIQGIQGVQGIQGPVGQGFSIAKFYDSVAALTADTAPTGIVAGEFAMINTVDPDDAENSRLYLWDGAAWVYTSDLSGAQGIQGPQGIQGIQGPTGPANPTAFADLTDKDIEDFEQTVSSLGTLTTDTALANVAGKVVNITLGADLAITGHDLTVGQSTNLIITQDPTGTRLLTWPAGTKFAGGSADLSTDPDAVDIVGVFYDGTILYVSISTGFATV